MFNRFERNIALRYLGSRRKEGFISVISCFSFIGIMLGVATLIVVMSVMNGFHKELLKRIIGINAHISVMSKQGEIHDYKRLAQNINSLPNIQHAAPMVQGQVLATANNKHSGVMVRGVNLDDLKNKSLIADNIIMGNFWDDKDPHQAKNSVLIGARMSQNMNLLPGDIIRLISPKTSTTFFGDMPRIKDYIVAGIFEVGMFEYDSSTIFMSLGAAQIYFNLQDSVNRIEVQLRSPKEIDIAKNDLKIRLGNQFHLIDWKTANSSFFNSLKVERNVMFLILTLIILIAVFNIVSGMVMLVTSKSKEVAILRTIGASRASIMKIFILCGSLIGVIGTLFGYLLGYGFSANIETIRHWLESLSDSNLFDEQVYFLSKLPSDLQNSDVYSVVAMSLFFSVLATLYPAWRAANISPIQGLRDE